MKLFFVYFIATCTIVFAFTGMRADTNGNCVYQQPDKLDMLSQRWINTSIEIYTGNHHQSVYYDHPVGYFQLNANNTYNRLSNNVPLNGKWAINAACRLELDRGAAMQRSFEIIKLTADSLVISRKDEDITYVQRYKTLPRPAFVMLTDQKLSSSF